MKLDLNGEELELLVEVLEEQQRDLNIEISRTDRREFRDSLKANQHVLQEILRKLEVIRLEAFQEYR